MDDITAKTSSASVVSATSDHIVICSEQNSAEENMTRHGLRLCSKCEDYFYKHSSFSNVSECAKNGCDQCTAAERGIRLACPEFFGDLNHPAPFDDRLSLKTAVGGGLLGVNLLLSSTENTGVKKEKEIELIQLSSAAEGGLRLPAFRQYERLPEAEVNNVTFEIIRNWINACVDRNVLPGIKGLLTYGHSRCDQNDFIPLPKRVLSLQNEKVRLVESNEGDRGKYACLSYCWGSAKFLRTLTSNSERHKKEISLQDMPRLFCDVVEDSGEDWAEQASKMADIYGNSFLTIAATAAQDPQSSLFERDPPPTEFYSIPHHSHHNFILTARRAMEHPIMGGRRGKSSYPLQRRGWVLQEDCLPPRTLDFLSGEVALSCCAGMMCECSDTSLGWDDIREEAIARLNCTSPKIFPAHRSPAGRTDIDTMRSWNNIVAMYTSTSLTRGSDKLPAISGMARAMIRDETNDNYLAGLWKSSLKYDLLWRLSSPPLPKPEPYRAPSWSWASIDGSVSIPGPFKTESLSLACEILETHCKPSTVDKFGQVCDGTLVLVGRLLCGLLEYEPSADRRWNHPKSKYPGVEPSSERAWVKHGGKSFSFIMDHALSEYGIAEGTELELVFLCDGRLGGRRPYICGLVLYRKPGHGEYRERVGWWSTSLGQTEPVLLWEAFQGLDVQRIEIR